MIRKVLLCCRGEIALRFIRSCRQMCIQTAIIHSQSDEQSPFVLAADQNICISSWNMKTAIQDVISAAKNVNADAIAPGYGPLAENDELALACLDAGFTFIGPNPDAIHQAGNKLLAREAAQRADVPVIPGCLLEDDISIASKTAAKIGYPLVIKAALGGGGRGIRVVNKSDDFIGNLKEVRQEAKVAFGSDLLYVERFLGNSIRHVEVQLLGDKHGNIVHLGTRGCSVQRRQQKIVEEAPAPNMSKHTLERLHGFAVAFGREVGYDSVGTVEFLLDEKDEIYFLEMNARVQVEHPVTEAVSGIDIVDEMIRIAGGTEIRYRQDEISLVGYAVEFRICAEDPRNSFLPTGGTVDYYQIPEGPGVRIDSGITSGTVLPMNYDSLCAKLITWDRERSGALSRARQALREFLITGFPTNIPFHLWLLDNKRFVDGNYTLSLFNEFNHDLLNRTEDTRDTLAAGALFAYLSSTLSPIRDEPHSNTCESPWKRRNETLSLYEQGR